MSKRVGVDGLAPYGLVHDGAQLAQAAHDGVVGEAFLLHGVLVAAYGGGVDVGKIEAAVPALEAVGKGYVARYGAVAARLAAAACHAADEVVDLCPGCHLLAYGVAHHAYGGRHAAADVLQLYALAVYALPHELGVGEGGKGVGVGHCSVLPVLGTDVGVGGEVEAAAALLHLYLYQSLAALVKAAGTVENEAIAYLLYHCGLSLVFRVVMETGGA